MISRLLLSAGLAVAAAAPVLAQTYTESEPTTFYFAVATSQPTTRPVNLTEGHVDIAVPYLTAPDDEAGWDLHVHDEDNDIEYEPDSVNLMVPDAAQTVVPAGAQFSFLGSPGSDLWVLPQQEQTGILFLGIGAEESDSDEFCPWLPDDERITTADVWIRVQLVNFSGPGNFFMFTTDSFGQPTVWMNTANTTDNDSFYIRAGDHAHVNWAFSAPGEYALTIVASTFIGPCAPEPTATPTPLPTATVAPTSPCGVNTVGSYYTATWSEPRPGFVFRRGLPGGSFVPVVGSVPPPLANVFLPPGAAQQEIDVRDAAGVSFAGYPVIVNVGSGICTVDAPATALPNELVAVNWEGAPGRSYDISRRGLPNGSWVRLATSVQYPYQLLMPPAVTSQQVRICDSAGSDCATVTIAAVAPSLTLNAGGTTAGPVTPGSSFTVAWDTNAPAGTQFVVQRRGLPNGTWVNVVPTATTTGSSLTFTLPNSTIDQEIRVRTNYVPGASFVLPVTVGNVGPG